MSFFKLKLIRILDNHKLSDIFNLEKNHLNDYYYKVLKINDKDFRANKKRPSLF